MSWHMISAAENTSNDKGLSFNLTNVSGAAYTGEMATMPSSYPTRRLPPENMLPPGDGSRSAALPKSMRRSRWADASQSRLPGFTERLFEVRQKVAALDAQLLQICNK